MSDALKHVHINHESVATEELCPPHGPRSDTPAYKRAHDRMVKEEDQPCYICGVRLSTLSNPVQNPLGATEMETHHRNVEWSLLDACDWQKVARDFPSVKGPGDLASWVNSPENLVVLCNVCHRDPEHGIHHLTESDWLAQKYLITGYKVVSRKTTAQAAEASDEALLKQENPLEH